MTNEEKRKAIKRYFKRFPVWAIWLAVVGLIVAIVGSQSGGLIVVGILIIAGSVFGILMGVRGKPSDQEMDEYLSEDLSLAKSKALEKISLDTSELVGEPLVISGPRFWNTAGVASFLYKIGKDKKLRFTPLSVTVLNMTQHQIVSYQACLDMTTGKLLNESTDEYFYKDIVSVSTKTESESYPIGKRGQIRQVDAVETFVLTTSGGTAIKTVLKAPYLTQLAKGGDIPTTDVDRIIQVVRKMLREKKQT